MMPHSSQTLSSFYPTIEGIYTVFIKKAQEQEDHTLLLPERLSTFFSSAETYVLFTCHYLGSNIEKNMVFSQSFFVGCKWGKIRW